MNQSLWIAGVVGLLVAACSVEIDTKDGGSSDGGKLVQRPLVTLTPTLINQLVTARPYETADNPIFVPKNYDPARPVSLVVALHGIGYTGQQWRRESGLAYLVDEYNFILVSPNGAGGRVLTNPHNAGWDFSCCRQWANQVLYDFDADEVTYLRAVIADLQRRYNIDSKRIYMQGHSMGGFMTYTYACRMADQIAAIAPLSGTMMPNEAAICHPSEPVPVFHMHGDADQTIKYLGGSVAGVTPATISTPDLLNIWGGLDGCTSTTLGTPRNMLDSLPGDETVVLNYQGCAKPVKLYTVHDGGHLSYPVPTANVDVNCAAPPADMTEYCQTRYAREVMEFFKANPKRTTVVE